MTKAPYHHARFAPNPASHFSEHMAATLSVRPNRLSAGSSFPRPPVRRPGPARLRKPDVQFDPWRGSIVPSNRTLAWAATLVHAGSRADDSAPFEMSVESALKLLGVSDGASFDEILRAKNSIVDACKDDQEAIAQVAISPHFPFNFKKVFEFLKFMSFTLYDLSGFSTNQNGLKLN